MFYCLISSFLDQESNWSTDQITEVYIYGRTRVSVLMTLSHATQGVVFPRKRVSLGDIIQKKRGLVILGGTYLKCAGTTKLSVLPLNFSFSGPRKYLVRGPNNRSIYMARNTLSRNFCYTITCLVSKFFTSWKKGYSLFK